MKDQILKIAIAQMRSGGYENLNFANIAAELNTSRANLHHHFKNKEGLGMAATEQYIIYDKTFKNAIFEKHHGDIIAILAELELQLAKVVAQTHAKSSCILSQLVHDGEVPEPIRSLVTERYKEEQQQYCRQISLSIQNGSIPEDTDVEALSVKIMAGIFGIIQIGLMLTDKRDFTRLIRGMLTSYLH